MLPGILPALAGLASGFSPVTHLYTSGTGATETVPTGASSVTITVDGGGAAGGRSNTTPGGGGGGARVLKTIAVTGGDTFLYSVGVAVVGRTTNGTGLNGNDSGVSGTVLGGSINLFAGGGGGGTTVAAGAGGSASGGDTNTNGGAASGSTGGNGAGGGAGGIAEVDGSPPGGGGGSSIGGTSGGGARGQIQFYYT